MILNVGLGKGAVRFLGPVVLLLAASCGDDDDDVATAEGEASGDYVVATTSIWADIAARVACDGSLEIRTIVPAGGDAHSYEPSLRDRETLDGATLIVANGLDLEESLTDTLESVEGSGVAVFHVADHVTTLEAGGEHAEEEHEEAEHAEETHAEEEEEGHDHEGADPHVWFDPTRVSAALPALGAALVDAGADAASIEECVATAQSDLAALDEEITATLAPIPQQRRLLVTNHDALGYFADRYDFEILGSVIPSTSTLTEASPGELEDLGRDIEAAGVPAIFTETLSSSDDAEALADRLGVAVVELYTDALGEPGSEVDSYDGLLRFDAQAIAGALG